MEQKIKVLVADDSWAIQDEIRNLVQQTDDMELSCAVQDGESALEAVRRQMPDVMILDIIMPRMDGFGVMEELSEDEQKPKVLILSELTQDVTIRRMMSMGADYYMAKPFNGRSLLSRIRDLAGHQCSGTTEHSFREYAPASLESRISSMLLQMGIPAHIKGYSLLREAIILTSRTPHGYCHITKELYPELARRFSTTPSKAERDIRHAIELAWRRGQVTGLPNFRREKPTNGELIACLADRFHTEN